MSSLQAPQNSRNMVGKTAIFFVMISVMVLFGALSLMFILTPEKKTEPFFVHGIFYANTLLLIGSSFFLHRGWIKRHDGPNEAVKFIQWGVAFGMAFLLAQAYGFYETWMYYQSLPQDGISNPKKDYLYVLSALHSAHLIGGLLFLAYVMRGYQQKAFHYFEIATYFWHFLGILWVYLLAVLTLT